MEKFEPAQIKISFSNAIGKIGDTATKLFYPLPSRKDKIISRFIELILSTMIYTRQNPAMQVSMPSSLNSYFEYYDVNTYF